MSSRQTSEASSIRVVFTDGGKGGVGKTEVAVCLATWYQRQGIQPTCIDFGAESNAKGSFRSFIPNALKFEASKPGALDHFFEGLDGKDRVVLADMSAGSGPALVDWFDRTRTDTDAYHFRFTAIGVTTNDPGAVNAILQSARRWQSRVDYLVVLNRLSETQGEFHFWHQHPGVAEFERLLKPSVIEVRARRARYQGEVRNHALTLEKIIGRQVDVPYFRYSRRIAYARRLLRQIYGEFDRVSHLLLPEGSPNAAVQQAPFI